MIHQKLIDKTFGILAILILFASLAFAQNAPSIPHDYYHQQMRSLMEEFKNATTVEQRKTAHEKMKQAREQYRAAHPVKELTPAEIEERRQKMEERLKKDSYRWQMHQLQQSMGNVKTSEERESIRAAIKELQAKHAAEVEAKLTPEQRVEIQARQAKNVQMEAELKPIREQMRAAKTDEERMNIHFQMREIFKKYR